MESSFQDNEYPLRSRLLPQIGIFSFKSFPALPTINSARRYKLSDGLFDLFFPVRESLIVSTN